jgi:pyruvate, orthophosphate dikinase
MKTFVRIPALAPAQANLGIFPDEAGPQCPLLRPIFLDQPQTECKTKVGSKAAGLMQLWHWSLLRPAAGHPASGPDLQGKTDSHQASEHHACQGQSPSQRSRGQTLHNQEPFSQEPLFGVPHGFVFPIGADHKAHERPGDFQRALDQAIAGLERRTGKKFGCPDNPLFVAVRSGAAVSMPGMMDSLLNVGLTPKTLPFLADHLGSLVNAQAMLDHLFHQMQALGLGQESCWDPGKQLMAAIEAVWASWLSARAQAYRHHQGMFEQAGGGTAVLVQAMVFGNAAGLSHQLSGTAVVFTRNPSSGQDSIFGEFLPQAQGEDLVAGICTPKPLDHLAKTWPDLYQKICQACKAIERHAGDMQDIELTLEKGELWILQTRPGKRTPSASIRIAHDLVHEAAISRAEALMTLDSGAMGQLLCPQLTSRGALSLVGHGLPASPGAAVGRACFDPLVADQDSILILGQTSCQTMPAMMRARGVVTLVGGMTSHAAVVMRGLGKPCVVGFCDGRLGPEGLEVSRDAFICQKEAVFDRDDESLDESLNKLLDESLNKALDASFNQSFDDRPCAQPSQSFAAQWDEGEKSKAVRVCPGDWVTLDAATGALFLGQGECAPSQWSQEVKTVLGWTDTRKRLQVLANADTPDDVQRAMDLGAEGVGLCRTEHMMFAPPARDAMQRLILAATQGELAQALDQLRPIQQAQFEALLEACQGAPLTVRLLDPPLHEFLPSDQAQIKVLARTMGQSVEALDDRISQLCETNPMLGHRGCRLALTNPGIYQMQVQALTQAVLRMGPKLASGWVGLMVPLIMDKAELVRLKTLVQGTIDSTCQALSRQLGTPINFGCMIETPRAALLAGSLAMHVDFVSFGTNDLTQMTWGLSRDDCVGFWPAYTDIGVADPFVHLDEEGVGGLIATACAQIRAVRPRVKMSVCGEHAGQPRAIAFFDRCGVDAVSCSGPRVPTARVAAAQSGLSYLIPG